ncbi:MAG TPA: hypothetical protein PLJ65_11415 [Casimicrobium sp.]|nr:hypothetical protein [Casimicrobium sp.]
MSIEIVTDFRVLMQLARAAGQAEKSGDKEAIAKAKAEHDAYKDLCLRADRMNLGVPYGAL